MIQCAWMCDKRFIEGRKSTGARRLLAAKIDECFAKAESVPFSAVGLRLDLDLNSANPQQFEPHWGTMKKRNRRHQALRRATCEDSNAGGPANRPEFDPNQLW